MSCLSVILNDTDISCSSKWYLCGSAGHFDKNEGLAVTFAEKAAKRGLASAEFALGYYREVGIGGRRDLEDAITWYKRVSFELWLSIGY